MDRTELPEALRSTLHASRSTLAMRAVVIATGDSLLPLLDRPFLQHVVEYLARQGMRHFDIVLSHRPEVVEKHFGDGRRWGCAFTYHLVRDAERPYRVLKTIDPGEEGCLLVGHGDRLPAFALADLADVYDTPLPLVTESDRGEIAWTGWAVLPSRTIATIEADWRESELARYLLSLPADRVVERLLDVGSSPALLASQRAVLEKQFGPLFLTGRELEPGVWLSRNVSLHPTARITAPVYIGETCRIGPGARVGPHAVLGRGCVLGRGTTVTRSLILPENYVGADLALDDVIVDRNRILRCDGTVAEADALLLGSLSSSNSNRGPATTLSRLVAFALLLLSLPLLLLTALILRLRRPGPVFFRSRAVVLPERAGSSRRVTTLLSFHPSGVAAMTDGELPAGLQCLLLVFLPALVNVVRGELSFAGVGPRTPEEVDRLPPEWRMLYRSCKAGLFTELALRANATLSADDRFATEAYYAAAGDWRYDVRLVFDYLFRALLPWRLMRRCPAI